MGNFVLSDAAAYSTGLMSTALSGLSLLPCLWILGSAGYLYTVPAARPALDRVSFRLMLLTMVFELGFNTLLFVLGPWQTVDADSSKCVVVMYWLTASLSVCNYLCTCIAINLMLCITFKLDPVRLRLERWYIGLSIALAFIIPIFPAALGHFGDDLVFGPGVCYFSGGVGRARMLHQVFGVYLWQTLSALVAAVAVASVITTLSWHGRQTARALLAGDAANRELVADDAALNHLQHRLVSISLKISLYPVVLFVINTVLTVGDLIPSGTGLPTTKATYGLLIVWDVLYGAKSMFFAALGIFVDPCLLKAWRLALAARRAAPADPLAADAEVSVSPTHATASTWDGQEVDFAAALRGLPYESELAVAYAAPAGTDDGMPAVHPLVELNVEDLDEKVAEPEPEPPRRGRPSSPSRARRASPSRLASPARARRSLRLSGEGRRPSQISRGSGRHLDVPSVIGDELSEAFAETIRRL